jgi:hypothetical protein
MTTNTIEIAPIQSKSLLFILFITLFSALKLFAFWYTKRFDEHQAREHARRKGRISSLAG